MSGMMSNSFCSTVSHLTHAVDLLFPTFINFPTFVHRIRDVWEKSYWAYSKCRLSSNMIAYMCMKGLHGDSKLRSTPPDLDYVWPSVVLNF